VAFTLAVLLAAPAAETQLLPAVEGPPAALDRNRVPAAGRHEAILEVARFGRYSISAVSAQGVALQLIDRMAGPGQVAGDPGSEDGRVDVFLDRGEYKIITIGHPRAEGEAELIVRSFVEVSPEPAEQLVELKPVAAALEDLQQRSFWLQIENRRWVQLEAAGRALRDLRLWQDGSWLYDAEPTVEILEPVVGQPLLAARLAVQLEPGLYLLTAYGGRPQPWPDDTGESPFLLRFGIPELPMAGRARFETSPFGIDRWLVPSQANYFRLELPEAKPASLRVSRFDASNAFADRGEFARIDKDSREPSAEVATSSSTDGFDLVTVQSEARQPYVLQHFETRSWYPIGGSGPYWISSTHSGHPDDSVDATAILAHWRHNGDLEKQPLREQTIPLDRSEGWSTRCNLLDTLTVFLDVRETGAYAIESSGTQAQFRIEPFFVYRPSHYEAPPFRQGDSQWELDAGYYVLTVEPVLKGILELTIKPTGFIQNIIERLGHESAEAEDPVRGSVTFPTVHLIRQDSYRLYLNLQPGVRSGLILRSLPLDLRQALPLTLRPGETIAISARTREEATLRATTDDGTALELSLDGGLWQTEHRVGTGGHQVAVRNRTDSTVVGSIAERPVRLDRDTPLPPIPRAALDALPDFPVVTAEAPRFFDLGRRANAVFLLSASEDGLFRLETTGLLDTRGTVRSRVVTDLASSTSGGSGRNFFLHQYLLAGDYQVRVESNGASAGHLGLQLTRTNHRDGGVLEVGLPARAALDVGESIVYRFTIDEPDDYRLRSFALGRTVRCRLEDGDGWPIIAPNERADIRRHFEPGDYRLVLLPEPVEGRRLTVLDRVQAPTRVTGHGPHRLALGESMSHLWLEPPEGEPRLPDVWTFSLSGSTEVTISLGSEMRGRLVAEDDQREIAELAVGQGWLGQLTAGRYRLEAICARRNNRVDYRVSVTPTALVAGVERELELPARVGVAVAGDDLVEIGSFGVLDVRARLEDESGQVVLASDDRPGDWNFNLAGRLQAGLYHLIVQSVDGRPGRTTVRLDLRERIAHDPAPLPFDITLSPGAAEHVFPLDLTTGEVLLTSVIGTETMGLALERERSDWHWETIADETGRNAVIAAPIAEGRIRLRVWSVDRRGGSARVVATSLTPLEITEARLRRSARLTAVPGFEPATAVAAVALQRPGTLRLEGGRQGVLWSASRDRALSPVRDGLLSSTATRAWLAVAAPDGRTALKADRIRLGDQPLQVSARFDEPVVVDLAATDGAPRVVIAEAMLGQPAVTLAPPGQSPVGGHDAMSIDTGFAAAVSLDNDHDLVATTWMADDTLSGIEVRLRSIVCSSPETLKLGFGSFDGEISRGEALDLKLPDGRKNLRLTLTPGVVAAVVDGSAVVSVHHGGHGTWVESLTTDHPRLLVIGIEDGDWAVEIIPDDGRTHPLSAGAPFESRVVRSGKIRIEVAPGTTTDRWLSVAGSVDAAVFVGDDGQVRRGRHVAVGGAGGTVLLSVRPGLAIAWIGPDEHPLSALWDATSPLEPTEIEAPARIDLAGHSRKLAIDNRIDGLLQLSSGGPGLIRVATSNGVVDWLVPDAGERSFVVPEGPIEISVRSLGHAELGYPLHLTVTPVTRVGEGLGPQDLLGPGDGRAYRFTVDDPGPVGVGVRADPDIVQCRLVDATGVTIGEGVVQMHELEVGDYYLLIQAPAEGAGAHVRPAVVGIERPPTGPPEDVIRGYVASEGSAP
jgi:hypothetical protein